MCPIGLQASSVYALVILGLIFCGVFWDVMGRSCERKIGDKVLMRVGGKEGGGEEGGLGLILICKAVSVCALVTAVVSY